MARRVSKLSNQMVEEASSWFIDFQEGERDVADREEFNAWLRRSPEHVRAYLKISALWEDAEALKMPGRAEIEGMVERARAEHNVVPLEPSLRVADGAEMRHEGKSPIDGEGGDRSERGQVLLAPGSATRRSVALAASVLLAVAGAAGTWVYQQRDVYATDVGEQRSVRLADGSSVELNSRSRLKVRFTDAERRIELLEGQALFRVAKNPARPFIVLSDETSVRAVGTQFDVYRKSGGTIVTVIEGRVAVIPANAVDEEGDELAEAADADPLDAPEEREGPGNLSAAARREVLLSAGQQVWITPIAVELPKPANVAIATAWTEQKLVFEETPLREVVEEFNRYNPQQLVIGDPALYEFHVSGVFPSTDSSRMLEFLKQRFGVAVSGSGEEIVISRREQGSL